MFSLCQLFSSMEDTSFTDYRNIPENSIQVVRTKQSASIYIKEYKQKKTFSFGKYFTHIF